MSKEAQNMVLQESITNSIPFHALAFHYIILCARGGSRHRSQRTLFSDLLALHYVSFRDFFQKEMSKLVMANKKESLCCKTLYFMWPAKEFQKVNKVKAVLFSKCQLRLAWKSPYNVLKKYSSKHNAQT